MSLQGSEMETDDPTTSYMLQVCHSLKAEEFEFTYIFVHPSWN